MKYNTDERIATYHAWQQAQEIPINRGFFIEDLRKLEVAPWDYKGGLGAFINLEGAGGTNDGYVCEIPTGTKLKAQKNGKTRTFEWHPGSLFAIPLNAEYQHFNGQGNAPVRFFAVTSAPFMMNLFHNLNFIFDNDFIFADRFPPEDEDYFSSKGQVWGLKMSVNFVPNTWDMPLKVWNERGAGG